jgi:hypothetical protein
MRAILLGTTTALVLAGSASLAAAGQLSLTSTQMQSIYHSLASEKAQTAPFNFQPKVGAKVPGSLAMYPLPSTVTNEIAATKGFEYAKLASNEVLLIDPKDRQVAEVIMPRNTTGSTTTGSKK